MYVVDLHEGRKWTIRNFSVSIPCVFDHEKYIINQPFLFCFSKYFRSSYVMLGKQHIFKEYCNIHIGIWSNMGRSGEMYRLEKTRTGDMRTHCTARSEGSMIWNEPLFITQGSHWICWFCFHVLNVFDVMSSARRIKRTNSE